MRYDGEDGKILISVKEFVTIARRGISTTLPYDDEEPSLRGAGVGLTDRLLGSGETEVLHLGFIAGGAEFDLYASPDRIDKDGLTVLRITDTRPTKEDLAQARGEAFVIGHMLCSLRGDESLNIRTMYLNESDGSTTEKEERVSAKKLAAFFEKCCTSIGIYSEPEVDRVTKRLPSMAAMKFPYKHVREGQREFVKQAYRTLARGSRLFACAPTGTGKTVSVIYPALKGLGERRFDKVFYLTPKTTTAIAARECLEILAEAGADIRGIVLSSKERCCKCGLICREDRRLCQSSKCNKLPDALIELYRLGATAVQENDVSKIAEKYRICPYELQLAYSELCDIVICDFNYLFDPRVYIRRFFTEGGPYAFLVDEAHNLVDRARDMYSTEFSLSDIDALAQNPLLGEHSPLKKGLCEARTELYDTLFPYVKEELRESASGMMVGAANLGDVPGRLYECISSLCSMVEGAFFKASADKDEEASLRASLIKELYYKLKKVNDTLQLFDSHFRFFIFADGDNLRMKLFCVDTGGVVRKALDKGYSAVLFSATLSPLGYYKALLGADRADEVLEVRSAFDPSQLSVSIIDKISTRYSERERTLPAVCRTIAATLSARRGNYMVFSPSFEYSLALADAFRAKYPKIQALVQRSDMSQREKNEFLAAFEEENDNYLVGFCVMGGIYSEGVDLVGKSLIGAVVVGIGMPALSYEREAMAAYFEDRYEAGKEYAYIYPGMNRVFQAAGRVIRSEDDRGVIVLIDDRFADPIYKKSIPDLWRGVRYIEDANALKDTLTQFWRGVDEERR